MLQPIRERCCSRNFPCELEPIHDGLCVVVLGVRLGGDTQQKGISWRRDSTYKVAKIECRVHDRVAGSEVKLSSRFGPGDVRCLSKENGVQLGPLRRVERGVPCRLRVWDVDIPCVPCCRRKAQYLGKEISECQPPFDVGALTNVFTQKRLMSVSWVFGPIKSLTPHKICKWKQSEKLQCRTKPEYEPGRGSAGSLLTKSAESLCMTVWGGSSSVSHIMIDSCEREKKQRQAGTSNCAAKPKGRTGWSSKFSPTPFKSLLHGTPTASRSFLGPIPDRRRRRGESTAPAHSRTSCLAVRTNSTPFLSRMQTPVMDVAAGLRLSL